LHVVSGKRHRQVIQRHGPTDWRVVERTGKNGPFQAWNTDESKTIKVSGSESTVTLTASGFTFEPSHVDMLIRLEEVNTSLEPEWLGGDDGDEPITVNAGDRRRSAGHVYQATNTAPVGTN